MTETTEQQAGTAGEQQESKQEKTFTQAEVDQMIKDRAERIAKQRYADYDDLKAKAGASKTLEEQLTELKNDLVSSKTEALRARVAAAHGISTKPGPDGKSDADLFLTGSDEDTLTAQAKRLTERESERKKQGNVAPKEGGAAESAGDASAREFVRELFKTGD